MPRAVLAIVSLAAACATTPTPLATAAADAARDPAWTMFCVRGAEADDVAAALRARGFDARAGAHCAYAPPQANQGWAGDPIVDIAQIDRYGDCAIVIAATRWPPKNYATKRITLLRQGDAWHVVRAVDVPLGAPTGDPDDDERRAICRAALRGDERLPRFGSTG